MDLQPLYEVQERLEHAAVAGTGILNEDFRLKRAREGLAPLAAASPVFAKISAGLEALLAAPPEKRGGALLGVLALVDAVVYTQASAGMAGELEPLPHGVGTCQEVSYGQLRPLLEALTGTGGGRYNLIKEAFANHPEYFADYRVIPALVAGLGDSYGELADLNADILGRQGPGILPLLEAGFDPAGGRGMARRVEVMSRAAGAQANDFFLAQLPQAVWKRLKQLCLVLEGKKGPEICALYRRLAGLTQRQLDRQVEGENGKPVRLRFACFDTEHQGSFRLLAALALCRTIRTDGDEELCRLAVELQGQVEDDFLAPAVAARLMTQPPAESYAWAEKQLLRSGLLGTKVRQKAVCPIQYALEAAADPALDIRWFTLLIRVGSGMDEVLLNLLSRGKVPDLPEAVGNYLYHMGLKSSHYIQTQRIIEVLAEQGWTKWDHFVVRWTQKNSQSTSFYGVLYILDQIPVSPQEKAAELRELDRLVQGKTLTIQRGRWPAAEVQKYLNRWEQQSVERGEEQHG